MFLEKVRVVRAVRVIDLAVRIHIERVIGILKNRYHILDGPMPLRFIKSLCDEATGNTKVAVVDKIVNVCAAFVNMEGGVVYDEK